MKNSHRPLKMTLFTDRVLKRWFQTGRVYDRVVRTRAWLAPFPPGDMKLAGAMTAFASNRVSLEYRRMEFINGALYCVRMV